MCDRIFDNLLELQENKQRSYNEMVELTDNMLNCNYSKESVELYALAFEQYASQQTKQIYMYISGEYFEQLKEKISV